MSFSRFMALALYDPQVGYYRQPRERVGRSALTDFYTATSTGSLFGELIEAAAGKLLGASLTPADCTFVELGTEQPGGIHAGRRHGFKAVRTLPLGSALQIEGPCVVFSNELFDAQPCRRFVRRDGVWWELGVQLADDTLREIVCGPAENAPYLPEPAPEGYILDAPEAATGLLREIMQQPWHGLFLACDYGKTWSELVHATPAGTARAYHRHKQSNDLLARPGEQDLTCHVCWDWLQAALAAHGADAPRVESQEVFLVRHAHELLAETVARHAHNLSDRKQALLQLIHPAHMGRKFQVLHALRPPTGR